MHAALGESTFNEIMYEDINRYHLELSHLKKVSRIVEESSLHPFLKFVYENNGINPGLYLYMYQLERDIFIPLETLPADLQQRISEIQDESLNYPPDRFLKKGLDLIRICLETGYVESYVSEMKLAVLYLYLFLDLNHLGYLPEIADIWFNSIAVNHLFHGSTVHSASRILHLFRDYMITGEADLGKVYRKGIKGLAELPEWYRVPLDGYISQRSKQKFDPKTVKNDIFFLLRFYSFLSRNDVKSFAELTGKLISDFNLYDKHGTSEGKNQCNCGIRRFLKYLFRESLITDAYLPYALLPAAAPVETLAQTLTEEEIEQARTYIMEAKTPIQLRDSAIFLLGVDMGLRGSDIVSLKLEDIDWKNECIRFQQQKTDVDAWSIMPVAVGNALFRYLKNGRPRGIKNDYLFVSISSPHKKLSRCICYGTLKRIFPNRKVAGSGFHVTRKTFSTNRLNSGASPEQIANALGHSGTGSLTPYLSLDTGHMCQCPLSLDILNISLKGGF
jgi:site-specific recombinase XerD